MSKIFNKEEDEVLGKRNLRWFRHVYPEHTATDQQIKNRISYLLKIKNKLGKEIYKNNTGEEVQIENFDYNGMFVNSRPGLARYKVKFNKWTNDPGIMLMDCSDGSQRLVPSCCLASKINVPKQEIKMNPKTGMADVISGTPFGTPSNS
jgi:hypothetical protein